ncbi:MAG TPA: hypothetical protein EYP17_02100 [Candidatus Latescibacteria bacterium]|nr:hypothetical protein [Candidatus Latescibacterota bacterium]
MQVHPVSHVVDVKLGGKTSEVQEARGPARPSEVVLTAEERKMLYRFFPPKGAELQGEPALGRFVDVRG